MFVEGFDAADTGVVSSQWLTARRGTASDEIEGDRLFRVNRGMTGSCSFCGPGWKMRDINWS